MSTVRIIYFSKFELDLGRGILDPLNEILRVSVRNNERNRITGALAFDSSWFVQLLEGEQTAVWSTFKRIQRDARHSEVTIVEFREIEEREFGNWWMGCAERTRRTAPVFDRFQVGGLFQPAKLSAAEVLGFLAALSEVGFGEQQPAGNPPAEAHQPTRAYAR